MGDKLAESVGRIDLGQRPAKATLAVHADDSQNVVSDVAPPLHLSTTFRYPEVLIPWAEADVRSIIPSPTDTSTVQFDNSISMCKSN